MPVTDPTFYRSPGAAVAAAPEQLAYVAAFDPTGRAKDALAVVDCDPDSSTYGGVVGWTELPTAGNELHHFGWSACSSALCHQGHHGHAELERRYLLSPAFARRPRTSSTPSPIPRSPVLTHTIEAGELAAKAGYSRPHTLHCGPGGIFMSALGGANGDDGPGGVALIDHDTFEVIGPWEVRPRAAVLRLRRVVAPAARHGGDLGVGHAVDDRERAESRGSAGAEVRAPHRISGACPSAS